MGSQTILYESIVHGCHFEKEIRSLASRELILWRPENFQQMIALFACLQFLFCIFWIQIFQMPICHKIGTLGARALIFVVEMTIIDYTFYAM